MRFPADQRTRLSIVAHKLGSSSPWWSPLVSVPEHFYLFTLQFCLAYANIFSVSCPWVVMQADIFLKMFISSGFKEYQCSCWHRQLCDLYFHVGWFWYLWTSSGTISCLISCQASKQRRIMVINIVCVLRIKQMQYITSLWFGLCSYLDVTWHFS